MKFLSDENIKRRLVKLLIEAGHSVKLVEKGTKNSSLFILAKKEERILLTADTDFSNTALYPPKNSAGIIVLRIFPPTLENQRKSLFKLLSRVKEEEFSGKLIEVWKEGFKIRTK